VDRSNRETSRLLRFAVLATGLLLPTLGGCYFHECITAKSPEGDFRSNMSYKWKMLFDNREPLTVLGESQDGDMRRRAYLRLKIDGDAKQKEVVANVLIEGTKSEKDVICRLAAMERLPELKDPRATQTLIDAFYAPANFGEKNPVVRVAAITALGRIGDATSAQTLTEALARDPSVEVRIAAAKGLRNYQSYQATEALVRALREEKDVALRFEAMTSLQKMTGKDLPANAADWEQYFQSRPAGPDGRVTHEHTGVLKQAGFNAPK
jgi:HEAT repeat protein